MSITSGAARLLGLASEPDPLAETQKNQSLAATPQASAWVSANAGTGKTFVLVRRVLRLLLTGTPPEKILCLTYTKAAASEMATRLFKELAEWAVMPDEKLSEAMREIEGRTPSDDEKNRARRLFATTLETPGSLKVQTIHAFCERVLARFPLEAGITPNSALLDEAQSRELKIEAMDKVIKRAAKAPETRMGRALLSAIPFASEDAFTNIILEAVQKRDQIEALIQGGSNRQDALAFAMSEMWAALELPEGLTAEELAGQMNGVLTDGDLAEAVQVMLGSTKITDQNLGGAFNVAVHAPDERRRQTALRDAFLTKSGTPRKSLGTQAVRKQHPALCERLSEGQAQFFELWRQGRALRVARASQAMLRIADKVLGEYERLKAQRAALDFDDLITSTVRLLSKEGEAVWVLYKLDNGFDHILIDEAQDTAPKQWELVRLLANEFFTGMGAQEEVVRTVFAVGDEKQSIYSFQGAQPAQFAQMGQKMNLLTDQVQGAFYELPLTLSFRTTPTVLNAVDKVFADPEQVPGVIFGGKVLQHQSHRAGQAGLVEIWPVELKGDKTESAAFDPMGDMSVEDDPISKVAGRIAQTIRRWLDTGEKLTSQDRPITPGDILILVKKRKPFVQPMIRALKTRNIPVAGADRMRLSDQIAVEDLIALGDFLLLPEDDLALACVLKSPMFGLTDEDLFQIGHGRRGSLWGRLWKRAQDGDDSEDGAPVAAHIKRAVGWLERWRNRADKVAPYDLYAGILDEDQMREKLIGRLGSEAADAVDEFLNLALAHDQNAAPSLQNFLAQIRDTGLEIKRDMDQGRNEVRIMTVHGAKGLEAEIVFLPDTCSTRSASGRNAFVAIPPAKNSPPGTASPLVWAISGANKDVAPIASMKEQNKLAERAEYNRLLYVAMTRARERLYVAGFARTKPDTGSWYEVIEEALSGGMVAGGKEAGGMERVKEPEGDAIRITDAQTVPLPVKKKDGNGQKKAAPLPAWAFEKAASESTEVTDVSPSSMLPEELAESRHEVPKNALLDDGGVQDYRLSRDESLYRGTLCHALLEHLPALPEERWAQAANEILAAQGAGFSEKIRQNIKDEALAVLRSESFVALLGPGAAPEVPLLYDLPGEKGVSRVSGFIDLLVVRDEEVLIIDYKTNRDVPHDAEFAPEAYVMQLAAYRRGVALIYPQKKVRCALLWTRTQDLMWLDDAQLCKFDDLF